MRLGRRSQILGHKISVARSFCKGFMVVCVVSLYTFLKYITLQHRVSPLSTQHVCRDESVVNDIANVDLCNGEESVCWRWAKEDIKIYMIWCIWMFCNFYFVYIFVIMRWIRRDHTCVHKDMYYKGIGDFWQPCNIAWIFSLERNDMTRKIKRID